MNGKKELATLERFQGVRRVGDGWRALCPAHDDRDPSLSVHVRQGRILLHCHAGCSLEAVLAAAGIKPCELFLDASDSRPRIVAVYDYPAEDGTLLFQVVRFEPKCFRQRRPDGRGGWTWSLHGVRRVLYRLPEALAAKSVLVVEGEKDAEAARRLGLVATCNPGGAGKWREEYSESLRGKRVAIIADADKAGRDHAQQVAASLSGKVESLKVVELPGTKDLSEWGERGGTREALLELIRSAPELKPLASYSTGRTVGTVRTWEDIPRLCDIADMPVEWLCDGLVPRGEITLLAGEPGAYKSWLALRLAKAVAEGGAFLGCECKREDVLYLDRENPRAVVCERRAILGADTLPNLRYWDRLAPEPPPGIGDVRLLEIAQVHHPLIVFDSFVRFHSADENSATEMAPVMAELRKLADAGATLFITHHKPKQGSTYRGSTDILAGVDIGFALSKDEASEILTLRTSKTRHRDVSLTIRPDLDDSGDFIVTDSPAVASEREAMETLARVISENPGKNQTEVVRLSGLKKAAALATLKRNEGKVWRTELGLHNSRLYFVLESPKVEIEI